MTFPSAPTPDPFRSICYASSELAVRLAKIAGVRLDLHVSTAKELQLFSDEPLASKNITAEACVAAFTFYADALQQSGYTHKA